MDSAHPILNTAQREPLFANATQAQEHTKDITRPIKTYTESNCAKSATNASIHFIGTATTIIQWDELRILTDPNFLHAGDHVHLGPGVSATRITNPAVDMHELPPIDCVLLSHYHEDHFDKHVEKSLNRMLPIITTPHAENCLTSLDDTEGPFRRVMPLDEFEAKVWQIKPSEARQKAIRVTGMPGKHVPPGPLSAANDLLKAVPPTNGWLLEMGYLTQSVAQETVEVSYRIYISGDTLFVDDLKKIPETLNGEPIDLMLVHLGGTTIPGPSAPLVMVTMDAKQGVELMQLLKPKITIPIHYDDYDVFLSPLSDFKDEVAKANRQDGVMYLERGEAYNFVVS